MKTTYSRFKVQTSVDVTRWVCSEAPHCLSQHKTRQHDGHQRNYLIQVSVVGCSSQENHPLVRLQDTILKRVQSFGLMYIISFKKQPETARWIAGNAQPDNTIGINHNHLNQASVVSCSSQTKNA